MKILVACEESQAVTKEFRKLGHEAYSCDLLPCSGGHPEWHFQDDVKQVLNGWFDQYELCANDNFALKFNFHDKNKSFKLTKNRIKQVNWHWDMIIAFPPCTYLTVTGNRWFDVKKYGDDAIKRYAERKKAIQFFMMFVHAKCDLIAIENPLGVMSSKYQKPNQIIQPYEFGDPFEKQTCLWLKGLNNLMPTKIVQPPPRQKLKSGKSMPEWYSNAKHSERSIIRSKTFPGIAKAMAKQWSNPKNHNKQYILEL
jgi:hypothetical protein